MRLRGIDVQKQNIIILISPAIITMLLVGGPGRRHDDPVVDFEKASLTKYSAQSSVLFSIE